jgi:hypothetical protein
MAEDLLLLGLDWTPLYSLTIGLDLFLTVYHKTSGSSSEAVKQYVRT